MRATILLVPPLVRAAWAAAVLAAACATAAGQAEAPRQATLRSVAPNGARPHVSEVPGTMGFAVVNPTDRDLQLRVLTSYAGAPERQYGRDVWVPAHATLSSWFAAGAPGPVPGRTGVGLSSLLYDRTDGRERLIPSPDGTPFRDSLARYARRGPGTAVLLDAELDDGTWNPTPEEEARANDVRDLVRAFRESHGLSEHVSWIRERWLAPAAEGFEGTRHVVVASDRLAADAGGLEAVRGWVQRGGQLWVMLDMVGPRTVAAFLGDEVELHVVDRISLTSVPIANGPSNTRVVRDTELEVEEPVDFVRVLLPGREPLHTVNGWPASFVVELGRGRVVFTALAARGWLRPRTPYDRPAP